MESIQATGRINAKGEILLTNMELVTHDLKKYASKNIIINISPLSSDQTEAQRGYYVLYLRPKLIKGMRELGEIKTNAQMDSFLLDTTPGCEDYHKVSELSKDLMSKLIDVAVTQIAPELNIIIE